MSNIIENYLKTKKIMVKKKERNAVADEENVNTQFLES